MDKTKCPINGKDHVFIKKGEVRILNKRHKETKWICSCGAFKWKRSFRIGKAKT